jgi:hypothetical protein
MREPGQTPDDANAELPKGAPDNPADARPGHGMTQSSKGGAPGPRLPHERDESAHEQQSTANTSPEESQQAYADAARGLPDTSYGHATDPAYHQQVTPGTTSPPPKRTR